VRRAAALAHGSASHAGLGLGNPIRVLWYPHTRKTSVASYRLRCAGVQAVLAARGISSSVAARPGDCDQDVEIAIFLKAYDEAAHACARRLASKGVKIVLDLCDNHLVCDRAHPHLQRRRELLLRMIDVADLVTCSTPPLASFIPQAPTAVVDDALEPLKDPWWAFGTLPRMSPEERIRSLADGFRLIWFGHAGEDFPPYGLCDVEKIGSCLARVHSTIPLSLTVVSNSYTRFKRLVRPQPFPVRYQAWRRWKMPCLLRTHHACIIPVTANDFTVCKTANRPATALRCGTPVVAEPIPSYQELATVLELGGIETGLHRVVEDYGAALAKAQRGRAFVDGRFASAIIGSQWISAFSRVLGVSR